MKILEKTNKYLIILFGVSLTLFQIYTALTVTYTAMVQRSIHLGLGLALAYLMCNNSLKIKNPTWRTINYVLNIILSVVSLVCCLYITKNWLAMARPIRMTNPLVIDVVIGTALIILLLVAVKRRVGWAMPVIAAVFLLYALLGNHIPINLLRHSGVSYKRLVAMGFMNTEGVFSSVLGASTNQVFIFLLFGQLLEGLGGGDFFLDLANAGFGSLRGGPAKVSIFGSALFGSISGSAVANVVGTGTITIPMMKRVGFDSEFAGAVESVASTGGLFMPPVMGAAAFIMSEVIGVSYWEICKAAILPAMLYYFGLYLAVHLRASKLKLTGMPKEEIPRARDVLKRGGLIYIPPLLVLIFVLGYLRWPADKACIFSCILLLVLALFKKDLRQVLKKQWLNMLVKTATTAVGVIVACACAGLVLLSLNSSGLVMRLSDIMVVLAGGKLWLLLLLVMIASIILGMGLPASACYIILAILAAPSIVKLGVPPIAAHLFVLYFGSLSAITPPVALAAYAAAPIAEANAMKIGFKAWRLAFPIFLIGYCFAFSPSLLFIGPWYQTLLTLAFSLMGVASLAILNEGYLIGEIGVLPRILWFAAGILLIVPELVTSAIGLGIALLLLLTNKDIFGKLFLRKKAS